MQTRPGGSQSLDVPAVSVAEDQDMEAARAKWSEVLGEWVCTTCYRGDKSRAAVERHLKSEHGVDVKRDRLARLRRSRPRE